MSSVDGARLAATEGAADAFAFSLDVYTFVPTATPTTASTATSRTIPAQTRGLRLVGRWRGSVLTRER